MSRKQPPPTTPPRHAQSGVAALPRSQLGSSSSSANLLDSSNCRILRRLPLHRPRRRRRIPDSMMPARNTGTPRPNTNKENPLHLLIEQEVVATPKESARSRFGVVLVSSTVVLSTTRGAGTPVRRFFVFFPISSRTGCTGESGRSGKEGREGLHGSLVRVGVRKAREERCVPRVERGESRSAITSSTTRMECIVPQRLTTPGRSDSVHFPGHPKSIVVPLERVGIALVVRFLVRFRRVGIGIHVGRVREHFAFGKVDDGVEDLTEKGVRWDRVAVEMGRRAVR